MANGDDETVVKIELWQPHAVHIDIHNRFRATSGYRDMSEEEKQFMELHVAAHEALLLEQHNEEMAQQAAQQQMMAAQQPQPA